MPTKKILNNYLQFYNRILYITEKELSFTIKQIILIFKILFLKDNRKPLGVGESTQHWHIYPICVCVGDCQDLGTCHDG